MIILLWLKLVFIKRILYNFKKLKNMKLRNLLYATMIACAFASCSKDDVIDPDDGGNGGNSSGKTMLQVNPDIITTKAAADPFTVYVINQAGTIVKTGDANAPFELPTEAEGNMEVMILKNIPASITPKVKSDLLSVIDYSENEASEGTPDPIPPILPNTGADASLNSAVYKVAIKRGEINMLGYSKSAVTTAGGNYLDAAGEQAIPMYRNVALVNLESIGVDYNYLDDSKDVNKVRYNSPSFVAKQIFILNARNSSYLSVNSTNIWQPTEYRNGKYLNGVDYETYKGWDDKAKEKNKKTYITTISYDVTPRKWGSYDPEKISPISSYNPFNYLYTYENTDKDNPTLLVVKGDFSYVVEKNGKKITETEENRYYTVKLGDKFSATTQFDPSKFGITDISEIQGLRRNIQYNVYVSIIGPGSDNPLIPGSDNDTSLDVKVELVNYGSVNQKEVID